jgi:hypothetical protein
MTQEEIEARMARLEDYRDICNLQGRYNHYMLSNRHDKILGLFSKKDPGVKIELADSGEYHGLEGVVTLFKILGEKYKFAGGLGLHMLMTPVVEVNKNGKTAKGMWHSFGCNTIQTEDRLKAMWQAGKYDIEFIKEDGEWKYRVFKWYVIFRTPFDKGWVKMPIIGSLMHEGQPPISPLYAPYDPAKDGEFLPSPPEPEE